MISTLGFNYIDRGLNPITVVWRGDLMIKNLRDPSHLRVREIWVRVVINPIIVQMCYHCRNPRHSSHLRVWELWVRVVVSPIIVQMKMCATLYQIWIQVNRDNDRTYKYFFFFFLFFLKKKKIERPNPNNHTI